MTDMNELTNNINEQKNDMSELKNGFDNCKKNMSHQIGVNTQLTQEISMVQR